LYNIPYAKYTHTYPRKGENDIRMKANENIRTNENMKITKEDACNFLTRYHFLAGGRTLAGADGILKYIKKVGCIQYDPLNMMGRNADLVLQSRVGDYTPETLERLLYKDRLLIDGWDKMMSIYSREDWPYFKRVRESRGEDAIWVLRNREQLDALQYTDTVLGALAQNGPMIPSKMRLGAAKKGSWGHSNLSSAAADYLFHIGKIGVANKQNVTKVFDLIENLLPAEILNQPDPFDSDYGFLKWYVYRRLGSVGMLWNKDGGGWLATRMGDREARQRILDELAADGQVRRVEVEGVPEAFYIKSGDERLFETVCEFEAGRQPGAERQSGAECQTCVERQPGAGRLPGAERHPGAGSISEAPAPCPPDNPVRFIAPLDNMIWDRDMIPKLFGFTYTWEVYVPAAKRKYGYYVIPVLCGNRFIARFEPEKSDTHVRIKNWWWENGADATVDTIDLVMREMKRLAACFHKEEGVHESVYAVIKSGNL